MITSWPLILVFLMSHATHLVLSLAGLCLWALAALLACYAVYEGVLIVMASKSATPKTTPIPQSDPSTQSTRQTNSEKAKGASVWGSIAFAAVFMAGFYAGHMWPQPEHVTLYGVRIQKMLPPDSADMISPETGPFRADFCPQNKIGKYELRAGMAFCRLTYQNRGCMDVDPSHGNKFTLVKNHDANDSTAILGDDDTFRPFPDCHVDDKYSEIRGFSLAR